MTVLHSRRGWNARKFASRFLQYLILSLVVVIVFVPVVILIFGALKTRGEFMTRPYALPIPPRWENITGILTKASYSFWPMLRNSMIVMLIVTFAVVVVCSLAAFVFARMEFRSKGWVFNLFKPALECTQICIEVLSISGPIPGCSSCICTCGHVDFWGIEDPR